MTLNPSSVWRLRVGLLVIICSMLGIGMSYQLGSSPLTKIEIGQRAPDFTAVAQDGQQIHLADYVGQRGLVLFFYPKDGTSVCTKEACAFRDSYQKFVDAGVEVIGISSDSEKSHREFIQQNKLSFPLISDANGSLRKLFGVPNVMGIIPGRVTYVIDKDGIIRQIFSSMFASDEHVKQALQSVGGFNVKSE